MEKNMRFESTDEPTSDNYIPAFLTPRLAAFASDGGGDYHDVGGDHYEAEPLRGYAGVEEEKTFHVLGNTAGVLGESKKNTGSSHGDMEAEMQQQQQHYHHQIFGDVAVIASVSPADGGGGDDDEDDDDVVEVDDYLLENGENNPEDATGVSLTGNRTSFPLSRVRELLKFHSAFSTVAKDAAIVASEAVELILQDLTRLAASEAARQQRKTITYADLARVVHYFDRFSFLVDIIPLVPAAPSSASRVLVGHPKLSVADPQTIRGSLHEVGRRGEVKTAERGGRMRQATLHF